MFLKYNTEQSIIVVYVVLIGDTIYGVLNSLDENIQKACSLNSASPKSVENLMKVNTILDKKRRRKETKWRQKQVITKLA